MSPILRVSIVVYKNDRSELKRVVDSVLNSKINCEIHIIDNSPTNDLESFFKHLNIIYTFNNANLGYGAGHNIAMKKTLNENIKYHLVLNPDIQFEPDILQNIVDYMDRNNDIGLLMPKVLYPNGTTQYLCKLLPTPFDWIGRRFYPFKGHLTKRNHLFELHFSGYNKIFEAPYLSGCFMFMRTKALEDVGLFDENIFMYCEDTDLSRRINAQYKTIFYPEVIIYHEFQKGPHKNIKLLWYNIQSSIYYFNKWGWFFDKRRKEINKKVLKSLGYCTVVQDNLKM